MIDRQRSPWMRERRESGSRVPRFEVSVTSLDGIVQPHEGDQKHQSDLTATTVALVCGHGRVERSAVTARARNRRTRSAGRGVQCMITALVALALRGHASAGGPPPIHLALPVLTTLALGRSVLDGTADEESLGFRARARAELSSVGAACSRSLRRGRRGSGSGEVCGPDRSHDVPVVQSPPAPSVGRPSPVDPVRDRGCPGDAEDESTVRPQVFGRFLRRPTSLPWSGVGPAAPTGGPEPPDLPAGLGPAAGPRR